MVVKSRQISSNGRQILSNFPRGLCQIRQHVKSRPRARPPVKSTATQHAATHGRSRLTVLRRDKRVRQHQLARSVESAELRAADDGAPRLEQLPRLYDALRLVKKCPHRPLSNLARPPGPPSNSVKFRQIPTGRPAPCQNRQTVKSRQIAVKSRRPLGPLLTPPA